VLGIAKRYQNRGVPFIDLIEEGNLGLLRATEKYDSRLGYYFTTYATWWIRQKVDRACQEQRAVIKVPVKEGQLARYIALKTQELRITLEREPREEEILAAMPNLNIETLQRLTRGCSSLDAPVGEGEESYGSLFLEASEDSLSTSAPDQKIMHEKLHRALRSLAAREKDILLMRLGMLDGYSYTLEETGLILGVTRERIRQIEMKAYKKLKDPERMQEVLPYVRDLGIAIDEPQNS
jgi:RNA polymerase primary sigma factor